MNRREFIKYTGAGLVVLGGASLVHSWTQMGHETALRSAYKPQDYRDIKGDELTILYLATLAPSGHNTQPWVLEVQKPKHWVIGCDKSRWLPAVDPENREMLLSIGAFIENLTVAAGTYGYAVDIDVIGKNNYDTQIAEIKLKPGISTINLTEKITSRRTIRNNYIKKDLTETDVNYLAGSDKAPISYYSLTSTQGQYLAEGTIMSNRAQAFREPAQVELANWIRWSNEEARNNGNGLTPESMEMQGVIRWLTKYFFNRQTVLEKWFREETVKTVEEQVKTCGGWLIIESKGSSIPELIETGRVLQRAWLKARDKMIGFHPMTQMLEENPWKATVAKELGHSGTIQFVVRVGYVPHYPAPVSIRMPLSKIIIG